MWAPTVEFREASSEEWHLWWQSQNTTHYMAWAAFIHSRSKCPGALRKHLLGSVCFPAVCWQRVAVMSVQMHHPVSAVTFPSPSFRVHKWKERRRSRSVCSTLCDPMDYSLPDSSIHGISQAKILDWVAISFSRRSSQTRDSTYGSQIAGGFFTTELQEEHKKIDISLHICFFYLMLTHTHIHSTIAQRESASTITHYANHMYLFPYYFYNKVPEVPV